MIRMTIALAVLLVAASQAASQEPVGCDKFKWPIDSERALLTAPNIETVASGAEIAPPVTKAMAIRLTPHAEAKLPTASERPPRSPDAKAGYIRVTALAKPGPTRITLSAGGWLDVIQDGHFLKSGAFSGATGCRGVRKSVTFDIGPGSMIVQFSGPSDTVGLVMTPITH